MSGIPQVVYPISMKTLSEIVAVPAGMVPVFPCFYYEPGAARLEIPACEEMTLILKTVIIVTLYPQSIIDFLLINIYTSVLRLIHSYRPTGNGGFENRINCSDVFHPFKAIQFNFPTF